MVCKQCGQSVREGIRFCPNCGSSQEVADKPAVEPSRQEPAPAAGSFDKIRGRITPKTIIVIALAGFVVIAGLGLAIWFYFFPPGVYVQDSFRKAHKQLTGSLRGVNSSYNDGFVQLRPPNQKFYVLLYETPASNQATVETTVQWKEGDADSIFGLVCCAIDEENFTVFMIGVKGDYLLNTFTHGDWYDLTGFLRLPKSIKIEKNVPYKLKLVAEGDYLSAYLNDTLLIRFLDAYQHNGRTGIYAQGGKSGSTVMAFDEFKAKKNSLFQKDK